MAEQERHVFQLEFDEEEFGKLEKLKTQLKAPSCEEVIRQALGFTYYVSKEINNGGRLILHQRNKKKLLFTIP